MKDSPKYIYGGPILLFQFLSSTFRGIFSLHTPHCCNIFHSVIVLVVLSKHEVIPALVGPVV